MIANNIPAFPQSGGFEQLDSDLPVQGMSLRDYFAANAMQAIMSNNGRFDSTTFDDLSVKSYAAADAMLKARQQ